MALNAAQLMVTIGANTTAAEQGIMGIGRLLGPGGILGLGAAGAAVAIAGIGIASTKMAADFQTGLTSLVTGAGELQSNMGMVHDGILQMSMDTGTSTKDLVNGLYMIESAGYHGKAGLDILKAASEGAKVGQADLGTVADATTTVLKDFSKSGITATQTVNALIATVAHGKTHMEDLAGALSHILPTASAAGISLRDVLGAMATMTGEGVPAADAATYLRQTLIALEAPSNEAKKTLASIGLTSAQVADEMHKSLPGAMKLIEDHLAQKFPVGSAAYVAALKAISGGSRQMQGMLDLTGAHLNDFYTNTQAVGAAASKTGDQVTGWALVQQTFNQKLSVFGETIKALMIQLGDRLLPVATRFVDFLNNALHPAVDKATQPILRVSGAVHGVTNRLLALNTPVKQTSSFIDDLRTSAQQLYDAFTPYLPTLEKTGKAMGGDLLSAAKQLSGFFKSDVLPVTISLGKFYVTTIVPILHTFTHVLTKQVLPALLPVAHTIMTKWMPPLLRIAKDILPVLNPLLQGLGWLFQHVIGPALSQAAGFLGHMLGKLADLTDAISNFMHKPEVKTFFDNLGKLAGGVANGIGAAFSHLPHFASGGVMGSSGLALVGEAGPEVVALPGGSRVYPNGGYGGGGGTQTIIVQIDGRTAARAIVPHLHSAIRQGTGARGM